MPDDDRATAPTTTSQPARAAFDLLLKAARECLAQGRFESAGEILDGARAQVGDDEGRLAKVEGLAEELGQRRRLRSEGVAEAVQAIEVALGAGQRMDADRLLFQAVEQFGEDPRFDRFHERLEALHRQDFRSDVRALIARADEVSAEGDSVAAQELWFKAQALAPADDGDLRSVLESVGQQILDRTQSQRRQRVAAARIQIEERIEDLDYPGARAVVQALVSSLGSTDGARELQQHLVTTHSEVLNRRVREAGVAFEDEHFGLAARHLRAALVLSPDNPWLQDRLRKVEEKLTEVETRRQADPRWRAQIAELEAVIEGGNPAQAEPALDAAEAEWGEGGTFENLRRRLERRRKERIQEHLGRARAARAEGDLVAAQAAVESASALAPDDPEVLHFEELLRRPPEEDFVGAAPEEIAEDVREIESLRESGDSLKAWKRVQVAIDRHGRVEPLPTLRRRIADELLTRDGL